VTPAARNLPEFLKSVATSTADAVRHLDDEDRRVYFLASLDGLEWDSTDARWQAALRLLRHDKVWRDSDALELELARSAGPDHGYG
jgi:hypothetical protein